MAAIELEPKSMSDLEFHPSLESQVSPLSREMLHSPDGRLWTLLPGLKPNEFSKAVLATREYVESRLAEGGPDIEDINAFRVRYDFIWEINRDGVRFVDPFTKRTRGELAFSPDKTFNDKPKDDFTVRYEGSWKIFTDAEGKEVGRELYFPEAEERRQKEGKSPREFTDEERNQIQEERVKSLNPVAGGAERGLGMPEKHEVDTYAKARLWLEQTLAPYEQSTAAQRHERVSDEAYASLDSGIHSFNWLTTEEIKKLSAVAHARVFYLNADYLSDIDAGAMAKFTGELSDKDHKEILNTPGVREVLGLMMNNDGAYFRNKLRLPVDITLANGTLIPKGTYIANDEEALQVYVHQTYGLDTYESRRAFFLAREMANIWGRSSYYDGIVLKPGAQLHDNQGNIIEFNDENDLFVNARILNRMYGHVTQNFAKQLALFQRDHWDLMDIKNSANGKGAANIKRLMYFGLWLAHHPGQGGVTTGLYPFISLFGVDAMRFEENGIEITSEGTVEPDEKSYLNFIHFMENAGVLVGWSNHMATLHKSKDKFLGPNSITMKPYTDLDKIADYKDNPEVLADALEKNILKNLFGAFEAYAEDLPPRVHKQLEEYSITSKWANAHLLEGVLWYMNTPEGKAQFDKAGASELDQSFIVAALVNKGTISTSDARNLSAYLHLNPNSIFFNLLWRTIFEAIWVGTKATASAGLKAA